MSFKQHHTAPFDVESFLDRLTNDGRVVSAEFIVIEISSRFYYNGKLNNKETVFKGNIVTRQFQHRFEITTQENHLFSEEDYTSIFRVYLKPFGFPSDFPRQVTENLIPIISRRKKQSYWNKETLSLSKPTTQESRQILTDLLELLHEAEEFHQGIEQLEDNFL